MIKIPTTKELYNSIKADLETELGITLPIVGKAFVRAFAAVQAGKLKLLYLVAASVQKNIFPDTADPESLGGTLERFGRVKLGRGPNPPQAGKYNIIVTGSIGAVIPVSTTFKSNDDALSPGKLYMVDSTYTLTSTSFVINVRALEAGSGSKLSIGDKLTVTAPIAGVDRLAITATETQETGAGETVEEYRKAVLAAYRLEPQGGAAVDYRIWASDVPLVKQTYPFAKTGTFGEINVYVEVSPGNSTDGKGTPPQGVLDDVDLSIELDQKNTDLPIGERGRRPLGVFKVWTLPVTPLTVTIEIKGISLEPSEKTTLADQFYEQLQKIRPYVAGADLIKNDIINTNLLISTILTVKPGAIFESVTMKIDGNAMLSRTFVNGEIPYFNKSTGITYV